VEGYSSKKCLGRKKGGGKKRKKEKKKGVGSLALSPPLYWAGLQEKQFKRISACGHLPVSPLS